MKNVTKTQVLNFVNNMTWGEEYDYGFCGEKVFIGHIADKMGVTVDDIGGHLLQLNREGKIILSRCDLIHAFPHKMTSRGISQEEHMYHFIERVGGETDANDNGWGDTHKELAVGNEWADVAKEFNW